MSPGRAHYGDHIHSVACLLVESLFVCSSPSCLAQLVGENWDVCKNDDDCHKENPKWVCYDTASYPFTYDFHKDFKPKLPLNNVRTDKEWPKLEEECVLFLQARKGVSVMVHMLILRSLTLLSATQVKVPDLGLGVRG